MSTLAISDRQTLQRARLQQRSHRASPMTVQPLFFRRHLAERLPRSENEKSRVVPEARLPAPLWHDLAPALTLEELRWLSRRGQGYHADESRRPWSWLAIQALQQLCRPLHLRWRETRRVQSWKATERVDFHARVVSEGRKLGLVARRLGFQAGVLGVGLPDLLDLGVE